MLQVAAVRALPVINKVCRLCLFGNFGVDVDELAAVAARREADSTADESIESVVFAYAYVQTGMVNGATLTFDNVACFGILATEDFYTESFAF